MTWATAVAASGAMVDSYAALVDRTGRVVPVTVRGDTRDRLPLAGGTVTFRGTQAEQWSGDFDFTDPWLVPTTPEHPLWGIHDLRIRVYWGVRDGADWLWRTVCTLALGDVDVTSTGVVSGSVHGRDVLSLMRGGYGEPLTVAGMGIDDAIRAIFDRCAPTIPLRITPTDVLVPASVTLAEDDPLSDALDLAAIGYDDGTVRSDRDGVVVVGPRPDPPGPVLDWSSGRPDGPSTIKLAHGIEHMGNQVSVVSTHADAAGLWVTVSDDDPSSPTWIGGPMGVRPLPTITTDKTITEAGLRSLGLMALGKGLRPTIDLEVTVPQRPDLDYRHPAMLNDQSLGVAGIQRVEAWSLSLPVRGEAPAPMRVGMMRGYR